MTTFQLARKEEAGPSTDTKPVLDEDGDVSMGFQQPDLSRNQNGGYISSDDEEDDKGVRRMNVEDLGVIDLTQDDVPAYDQFAPVRVARVAHRERNMGINADGATTQDGAITVDANDKATGVAEKRRPKQRTKEVQVNRKKYSGRRDRTHEGVIGMNSVMIYGINPSL